MYSAGVVFFEILTGRPAFEAQIKRDEMPNVFKNYLGLENQRPKTSEIALKEFREYISNKECSENIRKL